MHILDRDQAFVVRLERGEEITESLKQLAHDRQLSGAFIHGLGGASSAELALYKLSEDKQYHPKNFSGDLEIISLNGNISRDENGEVIVHCHAVISGEDLVAYGGHVNSLVVAGTCELFIDLRANHLNRELDDGIGLKLLKSDDS